MTLVQWVDDIGFACLDPADAKQSVEALKNRGLLVTMADSFDALFWYPSRATRRWHDRANSTWPDRQDPGNGGHWPKRSRNPFAGRNDFPKHRCRSDGTTRASVACCSILLPTRGSISPFRVVQSVDSQSNPKPMHATANKKILCYRKGTKEKGLVVKPTAGPELDCYVDADLGGLQNGEAREDKISARSRTGSVVILGGSPLTWKLVLQPSPATSTGHAEYMALSHCQSRIHPHSSHPLGGNESPWCIRGNPRHHQSSCH